MSHSFLTTAIPFDHSRAPDVEDYLRPFGNLSRKNAPAHATRLSLRLDSTDAVHFLSLNVVRGGDHDAHLLLEASVDGAAAPAIRMLANVLEEELPQLSNKAGLRRGGRRLHEVMAEHQHAIGPGWSSALGITFSGTSGLTVTRIKAERELAKLILGKLMGMAVHGSSALEKLQSVREELWNTSSMKWAFVPEPTPWLSWKQSSKIRAYAGAAFNLLWPLLLVGALAGVAGYVVQAVRLGEVWTWRGLRTAIWILLGVTLLGIILAGVLYGRLRRLEALDTPRDLAPDRATVNSVMRNENHAAQNHLFGVSTLKAGLVRRLTLRVAFSIIGQMSAHLFRPGFLRDLGTIHFARWILLPGTNKLVFLSNYGGSWESYLEDFITKAHAGLTAIWSNTEDFPKTENLFWKGATDGDRFKRWARRQQKPTLLWYTAYPDLTTARIRVNALIRQGVACAVTEGDAADWLACFGSAPLSPSVLEAPDVPNLAFGGLSPLSDGQALILTLTHERAREWLREIERQATYGDRLPASAEGALFIAFSAPGLRKLGLTERDLATFPVAFQDGMSAEWRARALGDIDENYPTSWVWGGPHDEPPDALMLVYADGEPALRSRIDTLVAEIEQFGHQVLQTIVFAPVLSRQNLTSQPQVRDDKHRVNKDLETEPFGFADGISQPVVRGTRRWTSRRDQIHVVEPGEILLGYPDNRQQVPPSPSVLSADDPDNILPSLGADPLRSRPDFSRPQPTGEHDLGRNGTFLVVRQLEQDVDAFTAFIEEKANELPNDPQIPTDPIERRAWIEAKLVGRWRDGTSLVRYPYAPGTKDGRYARPDNDFLYGEYDASGLRCPFGAHIRRANPRDSFAPGSAEQLAISNRHRILRVGRKYGPQGAFEKPGLFFMCLNADIERQFEFVQQTWAVFPSFHGLESEVDCFSSRGSTERISIPTSAGPVCLKRLSDFVSVRGGGYFFLPGRRTLRYLAAAKAQPALGPGVRTGAAHVHV
jgi:deferrochelatase/peroxidase EfeB